MERDFSALIDQLVAKVNEAGGELRQRREAAPRLDDQHTRELVDAYVGVLRAAGWLTQVSAEQLETILDVRVMTEDDGGVSLDVDSEVTGSVWSVPGWGTTETDAAAVGAGLAADELEQLEAMREEGELTGWE